MQPFTPVDEKLQELVWETKVPLRIKLADNELIGYKKPLPFYVQIFSILFFYYSLPYPVLVTLQVFSMISLLISQNIHIPLHYVTCGLNMKVLPLNGNFL